MGRAIVRDPAVFLFDEPLSNLDAKLRVAMRTEIKELHQRLKTTTVYVTHDQIEAMTTADRIVVMHDGIIEQVGTPLDLYDRPANRFVAGFIGSPAMNFLSGTARTEKMRGVEVTGTLLPMPHGLVDGAAVTVGVRPEHFVLAEAGMPARVLVTEPTGSELQILADIGGTHVTSLFRERQQFRPGETISLSVRAENVHLFEASSGARLS
jgi:multiple sugar transport system ATP-binding protein